MRTKILIVVICLGIFILASGFGEPVVIPVGQQFYDTSGNLLQAHGGGILKYNGYYYWFGENRSGDILVSCYRSTNLKDWEFRNHILRHSSHTELANANIERPKIIYNPNTKKFIMWAHKELSSDYSQARAAIATCDTVDGNYTWQRSFRPLNNMSRDCTAFIDDDGRAYFISAANENYDLCIYRLTSDYLDVESLVYTFVGGHREAPAIFKNNGTYFLITSGATGWDPNQGKYTSAKNLAGPWASLQNFGNSTTYESQSTYILPIQGTSKTSFLYMGDRWAGAWSGPVNDSKYVWLPINIDGDAKISSNFSDTISIDTVAGTIVNGEVIVDPANIAYNKPASTSSEETANPARCGNDGITGTRWCANDGNTGNWWKVDLGQAYDLTEIGIIFEFADSYQYLIEKSTDNSNWSTLVDQRSATSTAQKRTHTVSGNARYVRITYTGLASGRWASHYEFAVKAQNTTVLKGDVNSSSKVDVIDAMLIAQYAAGMRPANFNTAVADVNNSGTIDINDALLVARYAAGLISGL